jgi:hypothetical protein
VVDDEAQRPRSGDDHGLAPLWMEVWHL